MKNMTSIFIAGLLGFTFISMLSSDMSADAGTGSGASCMVTVVTTNEDGTIDGSVTPRQAPCRSGESNGGFETYNPYTDTYTYSSEAPNMPIPPLKPKGKSSSGARRGTSSRSSGSSSGDSSQTGGTTSPNTPKTNRATTSTPR